MNSNFADMIIYEQERAMLVYPSEEAFADMKEPFAYEFPEEEEPDEAVMIVSRAPPFVTAPEICSISIAQTRLACGTRGISITAASFRT